MSIKLNIVEKADSLFRTFGIRGVTVDDICKACGISITNAKNFLRYMNDEEIGNCEVCGVYINLKEAIRGLKYGISDQT